MTCTQVRYPRLRELLADGAQLVEVLPPAEYEELHLPDAISIPLKTLDAHSTSKWDRTRAVVVYRLTGSSWCWAPMTSCSGV